VVYTRLVSTNLMCSGNSRQPIGLGTSKIRKRKQKSMHRPKHILKERSKSSNIMISSGIELKSKCGEIVNTLGSPKQNLIRES